MNLISTFAAGDVITLSHTGTQNYWGLYTTTYSRLFLDYAPPYSVDTYTITASDIATYGSLQFKLTSLGGNGADTATWSCTSAIVVTTPTVTLASSSGSVISGASVTLTATLSGGTAPTGTVTFMDGSTTLGTGTVSGAAATFTTAALSAGSHSITAVYGGDTSNTTATSAAVTITVSALSQSSLVLSSSSTSPVLGASVTLTATLSGSTKPTGTLTFKDGSTVLGSVNASGGTATYTTSSLAIGVHNLVAVYSGDSNNSSATSAVVAVNVAMRRDPSTIADVRAMVTAQVLSATNFAQAQIDNVFGRFEQMHDEESVAGDTPAAASRHNAVQPGGGDSAVRAATGNGRTAAVDDTRPGDAASTGVRVASSYRDVLAFAGDPLGQATDPLAASGYSSTATTSSSAADASRAIQRLSSMLPNAMAPSEVFGLPIRLWSAGSLTVGKLNSSGASENKFTTSGVSVGADAPVANGLKAGLALGMGSEATDIGSSGSRNEATTYNATAYASWRFMPQSYLDVSFGYGTLRYALRRWSADGGAMLQGNRDGDMFYGSMGLTHLIKFSGWTLSPYVRMDVAKISLSGYTETGSSLWALVYDPLNVTSVRGVIGGRAAYPIRMAWGTLTPMVRLDYRHAFSGGFTQGLNYADLAAANYPGYSISELSTVRDTYVGSVALRADIGKQLAVDLEYRTSGGSGYLSHSLRGGVRYAY